jgi:hypothetical protein
MWIKGDYRVTFEHASWSDGYRYLDHALKLGQIALASMTMRRGLWMTTVARLQKRIKEGYLSAWVTVATGYAFCQDTEKCWNKKKGREIALRRGIEDLVKRCRWGFQDVFSHIFKENILDKRIPKEKPTPKIQPSGCCRGCPRITTCPRVG